MAFTDRTACAVKECGLPASEFANLCEEHEVPGAMVQDNNGTGIITFWYVERRGEAGVIVLNDFALGDLFGGRKGFEEKLRKQGFGKVRLLSTPTELEAAKKQNGNRKLASWSGPWRSRYPWEPSSR
jgi:hypothetical protein